MSTDWVVGTPTKSGFYWVETEDRNGWPSVRFCTVMGRWKEGSEKPSREQFLEDSKKLLFRTMTADEFNALHLDVMYTLDHESDSKNWTKLSKFENCVAYIELVKPPVRGPKA